MSPLELPSPAFLAPFTAFVAAALLALVPSWRVGVWINVAASCLCFLAVCWLPWQVGTSGPLLLVDRLAAHLALLTAFVAMTASWFSLTYVRAEIAARRIDRRRLRLYHAMYQVFVGGMLLALLSNNIGLTWMAIETATIAAALAVGLRHAPDAETAAWKFRLICAVGLVLALFGSFVLYLAALPAVGAGLPAMSWSTIIPAAARCNGPLLNLGFVFLLIGYATTAGLAPLHAWMADTYAEGPTPVSAILTGSMLNVALFVILRLRGVMAANATAIDPGPPLMALGLLSLLLASFSLWRRRDVKRFFAFSTIGQSGIVAFAFGLGGPAAIFAGVLHMTLHTLIHASVFQCIGRAARLKRGQTFADIGGLIASHRMLGLTLAAGILALAALPPFGLFASEFLIVAETLRRAPLASIPLGIGLVAGAWALIMRLQSLCLGAPTPDRGLAPGALAPNALALAPVWLQLAIVLLLGLAMPGPVVAWFTAIAGAAR
jgi:hydrogenase-4 component F